MKILASLPTMKTKCLWSSRNDLTSVQNDGEFILVRFTFRIVRVITVSLEDYSYATLYCHCSITLNSLFIYLPRELKYLIKNNTIKIKGISFKISIS